MHHVLAPGGKRIFPAGVRLLAHWNLRDQIKADYAEKDRALGLERQRLIRAAMERIVDQSIPKAVIDDPRVDWDPQANAVTLSPGGEVEAEKMKAQGKRPAQPSASNEREPDTRYAVILADFQAARRTDQDSPLAPTEIDRRFNFDREIPEKRAEELLQSIVSSPLVPRVAALIRARLGRPLEPHDVWYSGFLPRARHPEEELNSLTRARYPTAAAYKKDVPRLPEALAFTFQNRDLELLGLEKPDPQSERLRVLNDFWATWEIAGVGLVDLGVWRYMYAHPQATPAELREATLRIARDLWDLRYAKVLGAKGSGLLAIYSHMVANFLYLPDYPIGHLVAFQLEQKL